MRPKKCSPRYWITIILVPWLTSIWASLMFYCYNNSKRKDAFLHGKRWPLKGTVFFTEWRDKRADGWPDGKWSLPPDCRKTRRFVVGLTAFLKKISLLKITKSYSLGKTPKNPCSISARCKRLLYRPNQYMSVKPWRYYDRNKTTYFSPCQRHFQTMLISWA